MDREVDKHIKWILRSVFFSHSKNALKRWLRKISIGLNRIDEVSSQKPKPDDEHWWLQDDLQELHY